MEAAATTLASRDQFFTAVVTLSTGAVVLPATFADAFEQQSHTWIAAVAISGFVLTILTAFLAKFLITRLADTKFGLFIAEEQEKTARKIGEMAASSIQGKEPLQEAAAAAWEYYEAHPLEEFKAQAEALTELASPKEELQATSREAQQRYEENRSEQIEEMRFLMKAIDSVSTAVFPAFVVSIGFMAAFVIANL